MRVRGAGRGDRGSVAVEAAIVAPAVVSLVLIIALVGRIQSAGGVVDAAARAGARAASLERRPEYMAEAARKAAQAVLNDEHVDCPAQVRSVRVGSTGGVGTVTVEVDCTVRFDRLTLEGMPGQKELQGWFTSVIDQHRGTD